MRFLMLTCRTVICEWFGRDLHVTVQIPGMTLERPLAVTERNLLPDVRRVIVMDDKMLTLEKFEEASETVKKVAQETKLVYSDFYSAQTENKIYLKPENMQFTGAYKLRGAYYKLSTLSKEERDKGLITASAGNHAQGVAYAAKCYGAKAVIVMPTTTPLIKVNRTKNYGAEVVLFGDVYDEACEYAYSLAKEKGYTFIHPFDDPAG